MPPLVIRRRINSPESWRRVDRRQTTDAMGGLASHFPTQPGPGTHSSPPGDVFDVQERRRRMITTSV